MRRLGSAVIVIVLALAASVAGVSAQEPQTTTTVQDDPLFSTLFPPELIMQHRRAIDLSDDQRDQISRLIGDLQSRVVRLQWELLDDVQELTEIMSGTRVDLDRAMDQLGNVLDTEQEIKEAHLEMLVRIKNLLSPQQQATLERLRDSEDD